MDQFDEYELKEEHGKGGVEITLSNYSYSRRN